MQLLADFLPRCSRTDNVRVLDKRQHAAPNAMRMHAKCLARDTQMSGVPGVRVRRQPRGHVHRGLVRVRMEVHLCLPEHTKHVP